MTNRLKTTLLTFALYFVALSASAQQNQIVDSLKNQLSFSLSDSAKVIVLSELGREYIYVSPRQSHEYALKALQLAQSIDFTRGIANAKRTLGSVNILLGNYLTAGKLLNESLVLFDELYDIRGSANCYLSLGLLYQKQKEFQTALIHLNSALASYRNLEAPERMAICYNNIAEIYLEAQNYDKSKAYLDSSVSINIAINNKSVLQANYQNLGHIAAGTGQTQIAQKNYDEVLKIHEALGENSNINATCKSLIGLAQLSGTSTNQSIGYYQQTLELAKDEAFQSYQIQAHELLYDLYTRIGKESLATHHLLAYSNLRDDFYQRTKDQQIQALENTYLLSSQRQEIDNLKITQELKNEVISNQNRLLIFAAIFVLINGIFVVALYRSNEKKKRAYNKLADSNQQVIEQRDQILDQSIELDKQKQRLHLAQIAAQLGGWEYDVVNDQLDWYLETKDVFADIHLGTPSSQEYIQLIHEDDQAKFKDVQRDLILNKQSYEEIFRHITKNGEIRHVRIIAKPIVEDDRVVKVLGVSLDVTNMIDYQRRLEKSNFDKDIIQATVAHDLRSPLNNIISLKDLLNYDQSDTNFEVLKMMGESAERGLVLIDDLLESSELQDDKLKLKKEQIDLRQWFIEYYNTVQKTKGDKRLSLNPGNEELTIDIDRSRINRVIENIVNNARKFTPEDGEINIELVKQNSHAIIKIQDSGIGIPENMIPVLFDRFSKAKRQGLSGEKPHGLGMSIVKTIVDLHGGKIDVESEEGSGTTFSISLPLQGSIPEN